MTTTIDRFNHLVSRLDGPMVVVTTIAGHERAGCLVGFHGQCGIDPPRYAVWLSKANRTYRVGLRAEVFAIHLLGDGDRALAELFGSDSGDEVDKFRRCAWTPGEGGVPLLDDCPNRIVGRRTAFVDVGSDHSCMVLEPTAVDDDRRESWLTLSDVIDLEPGHAAGDPAPPNGGPSPPT